MLEKPASVLIKAAILISLTANLTAPAILPVKAEQKGPEVPSDITQNPAEQAGAESSLEEKTSDYEKTDGQPMDQEDSVTPDLKEAVLSNPHSSGLQNKDSEKTDRLTARTEDGKYSVEVKAQTAVFDPEVRLIVQEASKETLSEKLQKDLQTLTEDPERKAVESTVLELRFEKDGKPCVPEQEKYVISVYGLKTEDQKDLEAVILLESKEEQTDSLQKEADIQKDEKDETCIQFESELSEKTVFACTLLPLKNADEQNTDSEKTEFGALQESELKDQKDGQKEKELSESEEKEEEIITLELPAADISEGPEEKKVLRASSLKAAEGEVDFDLFAKTENPNAMSVPFSTNSVLLINSHKSGNRKLLVITWSALTKDEQEYVRKTLPGKPELQDGNWYTNDIEFVAVEDHKSLFGRYDFLKNSTWFHYGRGKLYWIGFPDSWDLAYQGLLEDVPEPDPPEEEQTTYPVTVSQKIKGNLADPDKNFSYIVSYNSLGKVKVDKFSLAGNQSYTLEKVDPGSVIFISRPDIDGYTTENTVSGDVEVADGSPYSFDLKDKVKNPAVISFASTKNGTIDTGIDDPLSTQILEMALAAVILTALFAAVRQRRRKEELDC